MRRSFGLLLALLACFAPEAAHARQLLQGTTVVVIPQQQPFIPVRARARSAASAGKPPATQVVCIHASH